MDILAFRRTASGQPWHELNIVVEPNQVLASNGAGQLLAVPKGDFVLSTQIGVANGVASLGADGKVPVSFLPDKAVEVTVTVANQAARFALTTASVQAGDRAKQSDDNSVWTLVDEANVGNAAGWVKTGITDWTEITNKPSSFDVEELSFALAHGGVQVVTITKKITTIHVEVGTAIGHSAILHVQGGSGGELVYISKATYSGGSLRGTLQIRTTNGTGSNVVVANVNNTAGWEHSRCVLQRTRGTMPNGASLFAVVNNANAAGKLTNVSGTAQAMVNTVNVAHCFVHAGLGATAKIGGDYEFSDGDQVTLDARDSGGSVVWGPYTFEFDENSGGLSGYGTISVPFSTGDSLATQLINLLGAMGSTGFSYAGYSIEGSSPGSITFEHAYFNLTFYSPTSTVLVAETPTEEGSDPNITLIGTFNTLVGLTVQLGYRSVAGPDVALKVKAQSGSDTKTILSLPGGGVSAGFVLSLTNLEPDALAWMRARMNPGITLVLDSEGATMMTGRVCIVAHYMRTELFTANLV